MIRKGQGGTERRQNGRRKGSQTAIIRTKTNELHERKELGMEEKKDMEKREGDKRKRRKQNNKK